MLDKILILDFGSQVTQLIARRIRELNVYCEIHPYDLSDKLIKKFSPKGIILSGGPNSAYEENTYLAPEIIFSLNIPILGITGSNGKTTTTSMLTGLIEPTDGYAEVFGTDIFNNMEEVRKNLGVCPQHDVLFEFLTPEDHLRLFAAFKGTE